MRIVVEDAPSAGRTTLSTMQTRTRHTRSTAGWTLAAALVALPACGGAPTEPEAVVDATPSDTPVPTSRPRRPRAPDPATQFPSSPTFPKGLDWLQEPPVDQVPREPGDATPSSRLEAEPLALALGNAVVATGTKLVADGPTIVMRLDEGAEMRVLHPMQTGVCYGMYALGGEGITELDVQIRVEAPPQLSAFTFPVLATDADTGRTATIGFATGCFKMTVPVALPAIVAVTAKSGGGVVALQILRSGGST